MKYAEFPREVKVTQEQVIDIIDHTRQFYCRLSEYYAQLGSTSKKELVRILLNYLSEAVMRHEHALAEYEKHASRDISDTWFQFEPEMVTDEWPDPASITPDMDVDAVVREVLRLDERLSERYRKIVNLAHSERIKEVFTNLLETNEKEMRNLARDFAHMHDW